MEPQGRKPVSDSKPDANMGAELWFQLSADEGRSEVVGQASVDLTENKTEHSASDYQTCTTTPSRDLERQQLGDRLCSLQLDFQDSRLSPALPLLQSNSGKPHSFTDFSLFQQTDIEFAPLRGSPDISFASDRFLIPPQDSGVAQPTDHASLSQHPLARTTTLSEDGASSCCSLSQHSMSPEDEVRKSERVSFSAIVKGTDRKEISFSGVGMENRDDLTPTRPDNPLGAAPEEDTSFLSGDIPARKLLELLQKDVGMPSGSSSAVSSASETSLNRASSFGEGKTSSASKPDVSQGLGVRECLQTGPETREQAPGKPSRMSEISNITIRSPNTQPDDSSEALYRQLRSEIERSRSLASGPETRGEASPTPDRKNISPDVRPAGMSKGGRVSATRGILAGVCGPGARLSAGCSVERGHRERDLWSSGNQTGIDGSFLGLFPQPVSQSTPGVFHAPVKSGTKPKLGLLSTVESNLEASHRSGTRSSIQSVVVSMPEIDAIGPDNPQPGYEASRESSGKVHSLPSLNYLEKVDAWRANQSSGKTSLFDSLALRGFSGVSPKQRAYDAISGSLNRLLAPQGGDKAQPLPASGSNTQSFEQNPTASHSGPSSPTRGEAVGCAPKDSEDTAAVGGGPASPPGRSQSLSSLSTVVTSTQRAQQLAQRSGEQESSQTREEQPASPRPGVSHRDQGERGADEAQSETRTVTKQQDASPRPSALMSLGRFSDVSSNRDVSGVLSSSEGSRHSGQNLVASVGASSVVSLEVDNYAPYWTSKASSPSKERELNIEERIPLYLHNLGIDQSPSAILTPFGPRGPIREPEFSPTDLCTIKGSIGTPTKSPQPSEGGTSHEKEEFSRSSLLSVNSSVSVPLSVDSLHPVAPFPEQTRRSPSLDRAPSQGSMRIALCALDPQSPDPHQRPTSPPAHHQQRDGSSASITSQSALELAERFELDSDSSAPDGARGGDRAPGSQPQAGTTAGRSHEGRSHEGSFVGSKTLQEIRQLLGRAENIVSGVSSLDSSSAGSQRHSDDDLLLSVRRQLESFQDTSFTSSSAGDLRSHSSLVWGRSSSDSTLLSDRPRESSVGREAAPVSAPGVPRAREAFAGPRERSEGQVAGSAPTLTQSVRRAEPEGCSAGPSDTPGATQPTASQIGAPPGDGVADGNARQPAPTMVPGEVGSAGSSSASPPSPVGSERGPGSDGNNSGSSSGSSLAARVARLLQSESPATMVSSRTSASDLEESRAREWIKLKVSGQQCEPLELDVEDRLRIEEIKRELLLNTRHTLKPAGLLLSGG